jgi:hypothetical protein
MFLSRTGSYLDILAWLGMYGLCCFGGWMASLHIFHLRPRERLFTGVASGLLLFIVLSDLLAHLLPISFAFWGAALLITGMGLAAAWFSPIRPRFPMAASFSAVDLKLWGMFLGFVFLLFMLVRINFGLAIFDDFTNLPIVSRLATGDIPLHFYLNPTQLIDYHYGLHLFAASLVRVGGLYPWIAMDISKALSLTLAVILAWLWLRRYLRGRLVWLWLVVLLLFAGGARWLLLFAPQTCTRGGKGQRFGCKPVPISTPP